MTNFQDKANFILGVADDTLRGASKQHEYGDVILSFVTLRWLDCVLEYSKDAIYDTYLKFKDQLDEEQLKPVLQQASHGLNFYNTSRFDLIRLAHAFLQI